MSKMATKKEAITFDYEGFIRAHPMRTKEYTQILSIVESHVNEARYRVEHKDFNEARKTLDYARIRIKVFEEDLTENGIRLNGKVDYLYALVENARRDLGKITTKLK